MSQIDADKNDIKIRVIDSEKLIEAINTGSYEINLSAVMALGAVVTQSASQWIPTSERLPEAEYPVIVTWKNDDPKSYYQYILGKHYVGVAHYKNGTWYWYSSVTEDVLMEYGRCDSEEFDEAIKVLAWMPLPTPYREGGQDGD